MKNCIVFGNCHANPIASYLNSSPGFRAHYHITPVPAIQDCDPNIGIPLELLHRCDLFIYQRTSAAFGVYLSTEYILNQLPHHCQKISIANAYFTGYYPQLSRDNKEPNFGYGDIFVMHLLEKGLDRDEIMQWVKYEDLWSEAELVYRYEVFMAELREREVGIDIPIASYIATHFRDVHLFSTLCHPRNHIIRYLACEILNRLHISFLDVAHFIAGTDFPDLIAPIYPSVTKHLKLSFTSMNAPMYALGFRQLTFEQKMDLYIDYHSKQLMQRRSVGH